MQKLNFDSGWEYTDQTGMQAAFTASWQPVHLPHDASIERPRSADHPTGGAGGYAWSGVVTYRKKFHAPGEWRGATVQLELDGVYMNAEVSLNDNVLALHPYGYTSFIVDLTPKLAIGAENTLKVVANNSAQPNSRWYSGTGIYRHAWLRLGPAVRIPAWGVYVTTPAVDPAAASLAVATELVNSSAETVSLLLKTAVQDPAGQPLTAVETPLRIPAGGAFTAHQTLLVLSPRLWSLEQPQLYTLTSQVWVDGRLLDAETTRFGIRTISVDALHGFHLNGIPLKLKGGCVHHDNGLLGAASYDRAEERKVELMKAAGFNAVRCAHNPPAPAFLDACDRLGMLVIDETFDCWRMGKNPNDYHLVFEDWWRRDTESMVRRDRNHPSIILWSIGNEVGERTGASDGYALARAQADFVRSLDPTRPVTSALPAIFESFVPEPGEDAFSKIFDFLGGDQPDPQADHWGKVTAPFGEALDVFGYNYLIKRYEGDGEKFPGRVMCGTETFPHWAYNFWKKTERLPYMIGDFVWTALDYLGESGIGGVSLGGPAMFPTPYPIHLANCGDIDICGFKRPQSYFRDFLWGVRQQPFIAVFEPQIYAAKPIFNPWGWEPVVDSWSFPGQEGQPTRVEVYTADEEVELLVNGDSAGRQPVVENKAVFEVIYQPGKLEAIAHRSGHESGRAVLNTSGAPLALRLTADRVRLARAFGDLAYITVEVVDQAGERVRWAGHEISLEVSGAGELLAVGTARPDSDELYVGSRRKAYQGRMMAVVRTCDQTGEIVVKALAEGLKAAEVRLRAD